MLWRKEPLEAVEEHPKEGNLLRGCAPIDRFGMFLYDSRDFIFLLIKPFVSDRLLDGQPAVNNLLAVYR